MGSMPPGCFESGKGGLGLSGLARLLTSFFYLGYAPVASGTVACLGIYGLYLAVRWQSGTLASRAALEPWMTVALLAGAIVYSVATIAFGRQAAQAYGREDPRQVVSDEVASACLALAGAGWLQWWWTVGCGFVLLRLLDILKPLGIRRLERLPGGIGILMDDIAAAALTWLILWGTAWGLYWGGVTERLLAGR